MSNDETWSPKAVSVTTMIDLKYLFYSIVFTFKILIFSSRQCTSKSEMWIGGGTRVSRLDLESPDGVSTRGHKNPEPSRTSPRSAGPGLRFRLHHARSNHLFCLGKLELSRRRLLLLHHPDHDRIWWLRAGWRRPQWRVGTGSGQADPGLHLSPDGSRHSGDEH